METRYRLAAGPEAGCRMGLPGIGAVVHAMACLLLAGLLAACQVPAVEGESPEAAVRAAEAAGQPATGKLPIIVNLAVGDGSGTGAAARVMERLAAIMPAGELAAVRTFSLFPVIALDADGELIARLLEMPEVASIERDHELRRPEPQPVLRAQ
ncbi:MAG: hypothetical protein OXC01_11420 [Immundisolibacterales bacterium]|nr:hypothetical protein [Immundisolibacterales bacterium]